MTYTPIKSIPQKLRNIASIILASNNMYWDQLNLGIDNIGNDLYLGISEDINESIRKEWVKLAEIKLKETSPEFAPINTYVSWALFLKIEGRDGKEYGKAHFVQMSHRKPHFVEQSHIQEDLDTKNTWEEDDHHGDFIEH